MLQKFVFAFLAVYLAAYSCRNASGAESHISTIKAQWIKAVEQECVDERAGRYNKAAEEAGWALFQQYKQRTGKALHIPSYLKECIEENE